MIGHIGLKCMEYIPEIVPVLITVLKDETPAVARQAIRCGRDIFTCTLFKVALQVSSNQLARHEKFISHMKCSKMLPKSILTDSFPCKISCLYCSPLCASTVGDITTIS